MVYRGSHPEGSAVGKAMRDKGSAMDKMEIGLGDDNENRTRSTAFLKMYDGVVTEWRISTLADG